MDIKHYAPDQEDMEALKKKFMKKGKGKAKAKPKAKKSKK